MEEKIKYGVVLMNSGTSLKELWKKFKPLFGMDGKMTREIYEFGSAIILVTYDKEHAYGVVGDINKNETQILAKVMKLYY